MKKVMRWDKSLNIGIKTIDSQHKILFDLANDLNNANHSGANIRVIDTLFDVIMNYAFKHFETEEGYINDENDFSLHCYQHYQLLKQLHEYAIDFRNGRDVVVEPGQFLEDWLFKHIRERDFPLLSKKNHDITLDDGIDEVDDFEVIDIDKRQFKRIRYDSLLDEVIFGHCYNATTLKSGPVNVVDLATGGLNIYSEDDFAVDDLLIISCKVGRNFKMKEKVRVMNVRDNFYGVEFVSPDKETIRFLTELCGAVSLSRQRKGIL